MRCGHETSIRIFGCATYSLIDVEKCSKLDARSKKCIFLEFHSGVNVYKLRDPIERKAFVSKNFIFDEKDMLNTLDREKDGTADAKER